MIPSTASFADELEKLGGLGGGLARLGGGALKKTLGLVTKHPMKALGVGLIAAPTIMAYQSAKDSGQNEGEKPRYLAAGRGEDGRIHASRAAYTNYHKLLPHKAKAHEIKALSKNYDPEMFSRAVPKRK